MNHIDLKKYLVRERDRRTGRPEYDSEKLLRVILFAFMENGYTSVRQIEKLCKTDIRFMWLLDGSPAPSFMTIDNFMNNKLNGVIEEIFQDINQVIVLHGVKFGIREEYAIEYPEEIMNVTDSSGFKS